MTAPTPSHNELALFGGRPINEKRFEWNSSLGDEESRAVERVLDSRVLSDFYGSPGSRFLGGREVKALEAQWCEYFETPFAVSMNSATSCLAAAFAAIDLAPGDEVICPPLTMSSTVVSMFPFGALPVFADVERETFCIDPREVRRSITPHTRAIVAVNLLGQPAALKELRAIAHEHSVMLIEDNAQAPGARLGGAFTGTIGDIGIFSLNCHKTIQCGEGGVAICRNEELALRMQLYRNHAEAVVEGIEYERIDNMIGQNYRMTEIEAAIAQVQLRKLKARTDERQELAQLFKERLSKIPFITTPTTREDATHVYYLYMLRYDEGVLGVSRDTFVRALNAEGYQASFGYVKPLYLPPAFQKRRAFHSYPFSEARSPLRYDRGENPVAESLHFREAFYPNLIRYSITRDDINRFGDALEKVACHAARLRELDAVKAAP